MAAAATLRGRAAARSIMASAASRNTIHSAISPRLKISEALFGCTSSAAAAKGGENRSASILLCINPCAVAILGASMLGKMQTVNNIKPRIAVPPRTRDNHSISEASTRATR
jgi:hypothetical protein